MLNNCGDCDKPHSRHFICSNNETHTGELELITWKFRRPVGQKAGSDYDDIGDLNDEEYEGRNKLIAECNFDYGRIFDNYSFIFRWTCCGREYDTAMNGCDHHNARGPASCSCDYCRMGSLPKYKATCENRFLTLGKHYQLSPWDICRGVEWTRSLHRRFPKPFQRQVEAFIWCHSKDPDTTSGLGNLPNHTIDTIIAYWADLESLDHPRKKVKSVPRKLLGQPSANQLLTQVMRNAFGMGHHAEGDSSDDE